MREIKFRLWAIDTCLIENEPCMIYDYATHIACETIGLNPRLNGWAADIMQFTGLQDITGKDIYEGDICKIESEDGKTRISQVIFENGCFNLQFNLLKNGLSHFTENYSLYVIGNIYENPELLEQGRGENNN